jgi:integrase
MPHLRLTERAVRALLAPDPSGKQCLYWDEGMKNFGVLVSATSDAKSYVVQGVVNGMGIRKTIGRTDVLTLDQARDKAKQMIGGFIGGVDPRAAKSSDITVKAAMEAYVQARSGLLRPRSLAGFRGEIERHLAPWLGTQLKSISREMVEARHKAIAEELAASRAGRSGHATANRVMRNFRALWNHTADRIGDLPSNPVKLKKMWHPVAPRERCLKNGEFAPFYEAAAALPNTVARDYVLMLLFTGLRRREAAKIRWADVDFDRRMFTIPATNTKTNRRLELPLTDILHRMLAARRALGKTEFVFFSHSASGHVEEPKSFFRDIALASGVKVCPHDMRRTYLTVAESCDIPLLALAALANHTVPGVTSKYVQIGVERLREPAQRVADRLKELCGIAGLFTPCEV